MTHYARNQTIFCAGEERQRVYFVVSGVVRICSYLPDGRRQISNFIFPDDCFGLAPGRVYSNSAEAANDVIVKSYSTSPLISQTEDSLAVTCNQLVSVLSGRIRAMQDHLVMLGCQRSEERVAGFLLLLLAGMRKQPGQRLDIPMSRQDIADYLGLTLETVCRLLARLKRKGIIESSNAHHVVVKDIARVRHLSAGTSSQKDSHLNLTGQWPDVRRVTGCTDPLR